VSCGLVGLPAPEVGDAARTAGSTLSAGMATRWRRGGVNTDGQAVCAAGEQGWRCGGG
jgi:hypothetical protein